MAYDLTLCTALHHVTVTKAATLRHIFYVLAAADSSIESNLGELSRDR